MMIQKKKPYEKPRMTMFRVQAEDAICSGSAIIRNPEGQNGEIESQKINTNFGFEFDNKEWDSQQQL